ncbi:unnamed protein product [Symbiodinium microadriaticum]|nr:unnamed protein product [Symbiodinium microadriaticum]
MLSPPSDRTADFHCAAEEKKIGFCSSNNGRHAKIAESDFDSALQQSQLQGATEGTSGELPVLPEQTTTTHDMTTGTRPKRRLDESERKLRLNLVGAPTTTTSGTRRVRHSTAYQTVDSTDGNNSHARGGQETSQKSLSLNERRKQSYLAGKPPLYQYSFIYLNQRTRTDDDDTINVDRSSTNDRDPAPRRNYNGNRRQGSEVNPHNNLDYQKTDPYDNLQAEKDHIYVKEAGQKHHQTDDADTTKDDRRSTNDRDPAPRRNYNGNRQQGSEVNPHNNLDYQKTDPYDNLQAEKDHIYVKEEAAPQTRRGTHHNNQLNEKNLLPKYRVAQNRYDTTTNYQHFQRGRRRSRRHPTKKTTESGKEIRMSPQNYHTYQRARRGHSTAYPTVDGTGGSNIACQAQPGDDLKSLLLNEARVWGT